MPSPERTPRRNVNAHLGFLGVAIAARIDTGETERDLHPQEQASSQRSEKQLTDEELAVQVRRFHNQKCFQKAEVEARKRYLSPQAITLPGGFPHEDTGEGIDVPPWAEH